MTDTTPTPPAVLVVSSWLPGDVDEEFEAWCDAHHRALLELPGVRRARRFARRSGSSSDAPDVLVTYELDDASIATTESWRTQGASPGPVPASVASGLRATSRAMAIAGAVPARWWPPTPSTLLDVFTLADAHRVDALVTGMAAMVSDSTTDITVRVLRADGESSLVLIDHDEEDGHDAIDALTDSSGANRSRWTVVFDESADGDHTDAS